MSTVKPAPDPDSSNFDPTVGRMAENILYFARLLRSAGMPVGPDRIMDAVTAVKTIGIGIREDFYWCMFALFVSRNDQRTLFDQAFHIFWRNPRIMDRLMSAMLPTVRVENKQDLDAMNRRLAEAMKSCATDQIKDSESDEIELDAAFTYSQREVLQKIDFEQMSATELAAAKKAIKQLRLPIKDVPTRRFMRDDRSHRVDMRATLRASLKAGHTIPLKFKIHRRRHPPLVVLCDISGSMNRYSRMFLHFMHAVTNDRDRVHTFVFATRLTNISRHLRHRDVDVALDNVAEAVNDWAGGTRIGACLKEFNAKWSKRVLGQSAITLIISDGLDRDQATGLAEQMERLAKSSKRVIWLNPLLRYEGFEARAMGVRAMLPWVDEFRSSHNLASLGELSEVMCKIGLLNRARTRS